MMIQEIEMFKKGPGVYGKAYGYVNYEKEYQIVSLLLEQTQQELEGRTSQFSHLKSEYDRLAKKLPEFEEMKIGYENGRVLAADLQKDNMSKAAYISGLQMKLVVALSEIERLRTA
jgi:hypothetical protein